MVAFCHGGNMPASHDDVDDDVMMMMVMIVSNPMLNAVTPLAA